MTTATRLVSLGTAFTPQTATAINQAINGKLNSTGTITLTNSATTTTITNPLIFTTSRIFLFSVTADAAASIDSTYVSALAEGSATLTHANNTLTRTFNYVVLA